MFTNRFLCQLVFCGLNGLAFTACNHSNTQSQYGLNGKDADQSMSDQRTIQQEAWTPGVNGQYPYSTPAVPSIIRDVHLINDDLEFTRPYIPAHRTSLDGRIALRVQGGYPGPEQISKQYSFFLFVPERLETPIITGTAGAQILGNSEPYDVPFPPAYEADIIRFGHHAICDPTDALLEEGGHTNPYPCGDSGAHDCYDLTLVSATAKALTAQLWSTAVTVEVAHPKTKDAQLVHVSMGEPLKGPEISVTNELLEPSITRDGKLLTARLGRAPRSWTNPQTGEQKMGFYDLVYFPPKEGMNPCDIMAWDEWQPMSHAPYDPRMIGKYGIAAQPFRDTEGNLIPDGDDLGGTYPWVDREAANVFMSGITGRMVEQSEQRFPRHCVHEGCESLTENNDWDRGFMVGGLWTHGKFVLLDSMINHLDWAIGVTPEAHFLVDLYSDEEGEPVSVRLGSGRFINSVRERGGPYPAGYTHNANIVDSIQNLHNAHPNMQTVTPRDVVWLMSNGVATDEVIFDDFLDPNAFILSNMQASITQLYDDQGAALSIPKFWNGEVRTLTAPFPFPEFYVLDHEKLEEIHIQNGATSTRWQVPRYGVVDAGKGRIEPAALGGIKGKGFWLDGSNQIRYSIPQQVLNFDETNWVYSLFVDPRDLPQERRILLSFPDESRIEWVHGGTLNYIRADRIVHTVELPASKDTVNWRHLAWAVDPQSWTIDFSVDGMTYDRFEAKSALFELKEGNVTLGMMSDQGAGFRGWVDDFKILAHAVGPEVLCNHAHGTLIQISDSVEWDAHASNYPMWAHEEIAQQVNESMDTRFACYHDYRADFMAHLKNIPEGTISIRENILFPEGPIYADLPRPDSSKNTFCLSCHTSDGKGGLDLKALEYREEINAIDDQRRQPSQPPARVHGNIPANWLNHSPAEALQAPVEGMMIDQWILDRREH